MHKKILLNLFLFIAVFYASNFLELGVPKINAAAVIETSPVLMDFKALPRDIIKDSVILENKSSHKLDVFAFVNNVSAAKGKEDFQNSAKADRSISLANWINFQRSVIELLPGEKKKIDFSIEVNLRAKAGNYHATILFADGSTRDEAAKKLDATPSLAINLEVLENTKERLQLVEFRPAKVFFQSFPVSLTYTVENIGNRDLAPLGKIIFYNRRGEQLSFVDINPDNKIIAQGASSTFINFWSGQGVGKYKALLNLEYGERTRGFLQDTIFFWIIPWKKILVASGGALIFLLALTYFLHTRYEQKLRNKSSDNS